MGENQEKKQMAQGEENNLSQEQQSVNHESELEQKSENHESELEQKKEDVQESLEEQIESVRNENKTLNDRYLRLMAEFDNYKKRTSRDYERMVETANERLMLELVEVRENFERALKAGMQGGEFQSFLEGMELIFSKFIEILKKHGLEAFGEQGEPFDPQVHDALMKVEKEQIPEDHIGEVFEKGYKLNDRVIKHAKVIVSSGAPGE